MPTTLKYSVAVTMEDTQNCKLYTREIFTDKSWDEVYDTIKQLLDAIEGEE